MITAKHCETLEELRAEIDRLDAILVPIFLERVQYIYQSGGRIKGERSQVPALDRVERQIVRLRQLATEHGGDPDFIEHLYRAIIHEYTEEEHRVFDRRMAKGPQPGV
ncbi:MAG: chorismate mutase [Rubrivivax sp.]